MPSLVAEFGMREAVVPADAEKDAVAVAEIGFVIGKIRRLDGTAGRAILGVEEQDHPLSAVIRQSDGLHVRIGRVNPGACSPALSCMLFPCALVSVGATLVKRPTCEDSSEAPGR